jgi:ADP-dependent NAD(P)H-hydrate dehydratase / NAD(P)H-hydrate epimerase
VFVVDSTQSAARDRAAIDAGVPSRALMQRAGAAVASELALREPRRLAAGVCVFAGPGNNGGDAWVVARALATTGTRVRVIEAMPAKTPDAIAERALALPFVDVENLLDTAVVSEPIVIDGLLGTGSTGAPRGSIARAVEIINGSRSRGALIATIDLPTGLDATTGEHAGAVLADITFTFGAAKRGQLVAREICGSIVVLDIGLGAYATRSDGAPTIVDEAWVSRRVPPIPADAHKGTRKKLVIVGGAAGMAGASILAARAAERSGAGMVRLIVAPESLAVVQAAEPFALAASWPVDDAAVDRDIVSWADGVVIGPGLSRGPGSRTLVDRVLSRFSGPVLLDADALNVYDGAVDALRRGIGGRAALLTPHPAEFARLAGSTVEQVLKDRFSVGAELAKRTGATVLLKGQPTVITAPGGDSLVSAAGTPILAAAGSGDLLSGIAGTMLTQIGDALTAGAIGAWIHGRAAELAGYTRVRGLALADVLAALPAAWPNEVTPRRFPVLLELPAVGERA